MSTTNLLDSRMSTTPLLGDNSPPIKRCCCCVTQHNNVEAALEQVSDWSNIGNVILGGFSAISSLVILVISTSDVDSDISKKIAIGLSSFQMFCAILYVGWIKLFIYYLYPRDIEVQLLNVLNDSGISKYLEVSKELKMVKTEHEATKAELVKKEALVGNLKTGLFEKGANLEEIRTIMELV